MDAGVPVSKACNYTDEAFALVCLENIWANWKARSRKAWRNKQQRAMKTRDYHREQLRKLYKMSVDIMVENGLAKEDYKKRFEDLYAERDNAGEAMVYEPEGNADIDDDPDEDPEPPELRSRERAQLHHPVELLLVVRDRRSARFGRESTPATSVVQASMKVGTTMARSDLRNCLK